MAMCEVAAYSQSLRFLINWGMRRGKKVNIQYRQKQNVKKKKMFYVITVKFRMSSLELILE